MEICVLSIVGLGLGLVFALFGTATDIPVLARATPSVAVIAAGRPLSVIARSESSSDAAISQQDQALARNLPVFSCRTIAWGRILS